MHGLVRVAAEGAEETGEEEAVDVVEEVELLLCYCGFGGGGGRRRRHFSFLSIVWGVLVIDFVL